MTRIPRAMKEPVCNLLSMAASEPIGIDGLSMLGIVGLVGIEWKTADVARTLHSRAYEALIAQGYGEPDLYEAACAEAECLIRTGRLVY